MPLSLNVSGADKNNLLVSLGALILSDASLEISSDNIMALVTSSGNDVPAYYATLFANYIEKAGGVDKFLAGPSAGAAPAAAAPAAAGAAPAAAAAPAKPKVEEVDALDGGMDMFGGSKGSDY